MANSYIFDIDTDAWSEGPTAPTPVQNAAVEIVDLAEDTLFVAGGATNGGMSRTTATYSLRLKYKIHLCSMMVVCYRFSSQTWDLSLQDLPWDMYISAVFAPISNNY